MRGSLSNPVECVMCGRVNAAPRDQRCHACRLRHYREQKRLYFPHHEARLRRVYATSSTKRDLSAAITSLSLTIQVPRSILLKRASQMGLSVIHRQVWTEEEREQLQNLCGTMPTWKIARRMHRTIGSVKHQMIVLGLSAEIFTSYSRAQLAQCLGFSERHINHLVSRGVLTPDDSNRIAEHEVVQFVRMHLDQVQFRTADEAWLKGILQLSLDSKCRTCEAQRQARYQACYREKRKASVAA